MSERKWIAPPSNCRRCKDTGVILSWNLGGEDVGRACPECERGAEVFICGRPPSVPPEPSGAPHRCDSECKGEDHACLPGADNSSKEGA